MREITEEELEYIGELRKKMMDAHKAGVVIQFCDADDKNIYLKVIVDDKELEDIKIDRSTLTFKID